MSTDASPHDRAPSAEELDAYLTEVATAEERQRLDAQLESDEGLQQRLQALRESHEVLNVPAGLTRTLEPIDGSCLRRRGWIFGGGALLTASLAALLLLVSPTDEAGSPVEAGVRLKGEFNAKTYVRRGDADFPWKSGLTVRPGDALRFQVQAPEFSHVLIVGIDGNGSRAFYPADGRSVRIRRDGMLPFAIRLDATPGAENFALVLSREALDAADLPDSLTPGDSLGLKGAAVEWKTLYKEIR